VPVVVADTGPLNYLIQIGEIEILHSLFGSISIPDAVVTELSHPMAPASVRAWMTTPPRWVVLSAIPLQVDFLPRLGLGERAVIGLGTTMDDPLVLMDDRAGVSAATGFGLNVVGTIGVLLLAANRGISDFPEAIKRLQATNFRVRPALLDRLLVGRH
jgi:predicted nucleic acid-binding protein